MTGERPARRPEETYAQPGGVEMPRAGDLVCPDFRFSDAPSVHGPSDDPCYPLGTVPTGDGVEYAFEGEPDRYPEMDVRALATGLPDGRSVPNTTYLTHGIHEHPAIFIPHIPSYLVRRFTTARTADGRPLVLDPFCGSGTTGIEALVNGRDFVGVEINPLSRLVAEVATAPIPPGTLDCAEAAFVRLLARTEDRRYAEHDATFLDGTTKEHWFEPEAIRGLTRIRAALAAFEDAGFDPLSGISPSERQGLERLGIDRNTLHRRVHRWLVLVIANTVFEVSNADPGISKAYKSKKMRRAIDAGDHPPDVVETHREGIATTKGALVDLWDAACERAVGDASDAGRDADERQAPKVDVRLDDARTFDLPEYRREVDLAITSPPYINAMNYYRGSKLRLFWIYDFLETDEQFDATELRRSIAGTNAVSMSQVDRDLPATLRSVWTGTVDGYERTRLPHLDDDIRAIHGLDHNDAERKAYVTWKFFAEDMLRSLARVYEHLKPGAYYFFVIGENTIGERLVHSHKYVADIARNLGEFEGHGGDFGSDEGFRLIGSAWDRISNRDLFQGRNHGGGVIECEWVVMLQKPPD